MKINIPIIRSNASNNSESLSKLKSGSKIRARILGVQGDLVKFELRSGEIVHGKSELPLDFSNKRFMNFTIKDASENVLSLTPDYETIDLDDNYFIKNEQLIMDKVMDSLGLEKSEESRGLINNMIKFKMPLSKDLVCSNMKNIDKIDSLLNLKSDEDIFIMNKDIDHSRADITDIFKLSKEDSSGEVANISRDTDKLKKLIDLIDGDIGEDRLKGIKLDDGLEGEVAPEIGRNQYKEITSDVKQELENLYPDKKLSESDIQKLVFLNKSGVRVSLNNLISFNEILEGYSVVDDIEKVFEMALTEKLISSEEGSHLDIAIRKLKLDFKDGNMEEVKDFSENLKKLISEISEKIESADIKDENLLGKINSLNDKLDIYNKINEKSLFMFVPLNITKDEIKDKLYFMSKRRYGNTSENIRAYISLDTENLKKVNAICDYSDGRLEISFKVDKEKMDVFIDTKQLLEKSLRKLDYMNVNINIKEDTEENMLDMISDENGINYMINTKV